MNGKILSIVIPTYNMSKYLSKCLDSLIVDSMDCVEILVINDGSKDNSSEIAHTYQEKYPNTFRVIDKENGNYGSCINRGLREANGKYVKILDADDYFDNKVFSVYLSELSKLDVDMLITDFNVVDEDGKLHKKYCYNFQQDTIINIESIVNSNDFEVMRMHAVTYRKSMLENMEYKQTEGISYTDHEWVFMPIRDVQNVCYKPLNLYRYLVGRAGQTVNTNVFVKSLPNMMKVTLSRISFLKANRNTITKNKESYFNKRILSSISTIYRFYIMKGVGDWADIIQFDNAIKTFDDIIYKKSESLKFCKFAFVSYFRNRNTSAPFLVRVIYSFCFDMKRKFSNNPF